MKTYIIAIFFSIVLIECVIMDSDVKILKVNKTTISEPLNFKTISKVLEKETDLHQINLGCFYVSYKLP